MTEKDTEKPGDLRKMKLGLGKIIQFKDQIQKKFEEIKIRMRQPLSQEQDPMQESIKIME